MPHMTGDVLAKKKLAIRPGLLVVLCIGYRTRINKEKAMGIGIRAFLGKPVLRGELACTVRRILGNGHYEYWALDLPKQIAVELPP